MQKRKINHAIVNGGGNYYCLAYSPVRVDPQNNIETQYPEHISG